MEQKIKRLTFALLALTMKLAGCKSKKTVQIPEEEPTTDYTAIVAGFASVTPDTATVQYISGNATLKLNVDGSNVSLKGKLHIKRGEGVQISITPLGLIEAACVEFLPQKVRLINKLTKKYTEVPYSEASAIGLGGINYKVLEAIFLNHAFLPDGRLAYKGLKEMDIADKGSSYHLSTKGNATMKYSFLIDKNSGELTSCSGVSSTGESVKCEYSDFANIGSVSYPNNLCIGFNGDSKIILDIDLNKISNKSFSFSSRSITSSYRKQSIDDFLKSIK